MKNLQIPAPEPQIADIEGLRSKTLQRNKKTAAILAISIIVTTLALMIVGKSVSAYFYRQHSRKVSFKRICAIRDTKNLETPMDNQISILPITEEKLNSELSIGYQRKFIHDFENNVTGIVDISERRCFFMPINHTITPHDVSLENWAKNLWRSLYSTRENVVEFSMHAVLPPTNDTNLTGRYLYEECRNYPIYQLEKTEGSQDIAQSSGDILKYSDILGAIKQEIYITNIYDVLGYEKNTNNY